MDKADNTILMGCLLKDRNLLSRAVERLGRYQLFDVITDPVDAYLWNVLASCYRAYKDVPTSLLFLTEVGGRLTRSHYDAAFRDKVTRTARSLVKIPAEQFKGPMGRSYLEAALAIAIKVDWLNRMKSMRNLDDMRAFMAETNTAVSGAKNDTSSRSKPLLDLPRHMVRKNRWPTGIRFWDEMLGGGIASAEMIGLLGPSGGGKTVLAIGLVCERAKREEHSLYFSYEEPAEGDITERLCAYMTGIPIWKFRDKQHGDLPPELQEAVRVAGEKWGKYLTVVDLSKGDAGLGGPEEVIEHLEQSWREDEGANLIVVDWLGAMVARYMSVHKMDPKQWPSVADNFLDTIGRHLRDKQRTSAVVFHQLRGEVADSSPAYKPTKNDGENWKGFPNKMDACYQLGVLDKESHIAWFIGDKNRRNAISDIMVQLDGEHVRFVRPEGTYQIDHRHRFVSTKGEAEQLNKERKVRDRYA